MTEDKMDEIYPVKYEVSGHLPSGYYNNFETEMPTGAWAVVNPSARKCEEGDRKDNERPYIIHVVVGAGSLDGAQMLCDAMNSSERWRKAANRK